MVKLAKTAHRKPMMDTSKSHDCPKCGKPTRIVKRMKDRGESYKLEILQREANAAEVSVNFYRSAVA